MNRNNVTTKTTRMNTWNKYHCMRVKMSVCFLKLSLLSRSEQILSEDISSGPNILCASSKHHEMRTASRLHNIAAELIYQQQPKGFFRWNACGERRFSVETGETPSLGFPSAADFV